ncbi:MAG: hypothetical protein ACK2T7_12660 [Anaerolineales bacterium]
MRIRNLELWLALVVIVLVTVFYLTAVAILDAPPASGLIGHSLGILGFILMLMTEVLYSLRKRYQFARWGKMKDWLSFHIFTGVVGPYLVLLHTSWKFNGLAGLLTLMTVMIVISGFVGRYFYTAIPRSVDGAEVELGQLRQLAEENKHRLAEIQQLRPELYQQVEGLFSFSAQRGRFRREWKKLASSLGGEDRTLVVRLRHVWERQALLNRQMGQLATARKLLAVWHTVHIPLGVAMFTIAFIHIGAALYYATLLR